MSARWSSFVLTLASAPWCPLAISSHWPSSKAWWMTDSEGEIPTSINASLSFPTGSGGGQNELCKMDAKSYFYRRTPLALFISEGFPHACLTFIHEIPGCKENLAIYTSFRNNQSTNCGLDKANTLQSASCNFSVGYISLNFLLNWTHGSIWGLFILIYWLLDALGGNGVGI